MGVGMSKDEELFGATQRGDLRAIRGLRQQGASLEWKDPKDRTPLIVACSHPEGFDSAAALLQLGANVSAYRPGPEGGYPVHHAVKKGLDRTLHLLLENGANLMVVNDLGQTPLQMAREKGYTTTVRLIEDRISLFRGYMRQQVMSTPGFLEALAGNWIFKRVWVAVVPTSLDPRRPPRFELAIYNTSQAALPSVKVALEVARLSVAKPDSKDPILVIEDAISNSKYKLSGDKDTPNCASQVQKVFNACRGIPQGAPLSNVPQWQTPAPFTLPSPSSSGGVQSVVSASGFGNTSSGVGGKATALDDDDVALKLAISESLKEHQNSLQQQGASSSDSYGGWDGDGVSERKASYGGWGPSDPTPAAPPTRPTVNNANSSSSSPPPPLPFPSSTVPPLHEESPSAPPLPPQLAGAIHYPSVDTTPVKSPILPHSVSTKDGSRCCVCLDAPKQGACVPCGHLACCMDCLQEIKMARGECPMCRAPIREIIKVYQV